jgi:hypothetical protein
MHPLQRGLGAIYDSCYHNGARAIGRIAHFLDLEEEAFEEIFSGSYLAIWAMRRVFARAKLGIVRAGCPAGQSNPGGTHAARIVCVRHVASAFQRVCERH